MKITFRGEMTLAQIRQAVFEMLHELEETYAVRHSRGATLYINPTNGFGDDVVPRRSNGEPVHDLQSRAPYRSAADDYKI